MNEYMLRLETALKELTEELKAVGIHNPHNPSDWIAVPETVDANEADPDMTADIIEEWDERQALVATLERRWNDTTRALGKIEAGTFGSCEICGAAIEHERLDVNPAARTCKAHMNDEGMLTL